LFIDPTADTPAVYRSYRKPESHRSLAALVCDFQPGLRAEQRRQPALEVMEAVSGPDGICREARSIIVNFKAYLAAAGAGRDANRSPSMRLATACLTEFSTSV